MWRRPSRSLEPWQPPEPARVGARLTVAPAIVPAGNPEPVRVVLFTPAAPDERLALAESVCAQPIEVPRRTRAAASAACFSANPVRSVIDAFTQVPGLVVNVTLLA